jgi:hypothetical protein
MPVVLTKPTADCNKIMKNTTFNIVDHGPPEPHFSLLESFMYIATATSAVSAIMPHTCVGLVEFNQPKYANYAASIGVIMLKNLMFRWLAILIMKNNSITAIQL